MDMKEVHAKVCRRVALRERIAMLKAQLKAAKGEYETVESDLEKRVLSWKQGELPLTNGQPEKPAKPPRGQRTRKRGSGIPAALAGVQ